VGHKIIKIFYYYIMARKTKRTTRAKRPSRGTKRPSRGTKRPSRGTKRPSRGTKRPSRGTKRPSRGTKRPSRGTKRPSRGTKRTSGRMKKIKLAKNMKKSSNSKIVVKKGKCEAMILDDNDSEDPCNIHMSINECMNETKDTEYWRSYNCKWIE